jgi:4-amino-4-deoxychorismate lyase
MFWYDGKLVENNHISLEISNPGLIYGATVFTTLRVYNNSLDHPLTHWQQHCDRLKRSLIQFEWPLPDWQEIIDGAEQLLTHYPILRIVIFPDRKIWITGRFLPEDLTIRQQEGIIGWVADSLLFKRSLADYKTGNYLTAWLALQKAQKQGAKEAILINDYNHWLETSTGNLWGWKNNCFWTPPDNGTILPGITRSQLLRWLLQQNIEVKQDHWTADLIQSFESIAYSNCGVEIIPFSQILNQSQILEFDPKHPSLKLLKSYFQQEKLT